LINFFQNSFFFQFLHEPHLCMSVLFTYKLRNSCKWFITHTTTYAVGQTSRSGVVGPCILLHKIHCKVNRTLKWKFIPVNLHMHPFRGTIYMYPVGNWFELVMSYRFNRTGHFWHNTTKGRSCGASNLVTSRDKCSVLICPSSAQENCQWVRYEKCFCNGTVLQFA
jgi:hypothetical protein